MNKLQFLNLLLGLNLMLLIVGCQTKDQKYTNEIVGNYIVESKANNTEGNPLLLHISFNKDHTVTYSCYMDYSLLFIKKTLSFKVNGHWEIKDGFLTSTFDGYNFEPKEILFIVQKEMEDFYNKLSRNPYDKIIELNLQRLVLSGPDGELTYLQRDYSERNTENNSSIKMNDQNTENTDIDGLKIIWNDTSNVTTQK